MSQDALQTFSALRKIYHARTTKGNTTVLNMFELGSRNPKKSENVAPDIHFARRLNSWMQGMVQIGAQGKYAR